MMRWYEIHTDEFRQATFVDGQPVVSDPDTAPPDPEGPFNIVGQTVDDYVDTLRRSGFFSPRYLTTLRARVTTTTDALERHQPPKDQMPSIDGIPLFALNYDDMMEQKSHFVFTVAQNGHIVTFNDGYSLMRFAFDSTCKIDSISSKQLP